MNGHREHPQVPWLVAISDGAKLHLRHIRFDADASAEHIGRSLKQEDDRVRGGFSHLIGRTMCERVVEIIPRTTISYGLGSLDLEHGNATLEYSAHRNPKARHEGLTRALQHPEKVAAFHNFASHFPNLAVGAPVKDAEIILILSYQSRTASTLLAALEVLLAFGVAVGTGLWGRGKVALGLAILLPALVLLVLVMALSLILGARR